MTDPAEITLLSDLVAARARAAPEATAVVHGERRWSYAELDATVDRVAAALQRDGAAPGSAVAVCAASSPEYVAVFLGALRAGLAAAPLAPSSTPEQLAVMVADSGAAHLFLDAANGEALAPVADRIAARRIALDGSNAGEPFTGWLAATGTEPAPVQIAPGDPFNIIYSSGTTGTPKGIVHSHRMRWGLYALAEGLGYGPDAVVMVSTPLYSNTTLAAVLPALGAGGALVLMEKFDAGRFLALAERWRATNAMLVPVQYRRLMDHPDFDAHDLSSFRMKYATSAPFAADLKAQVLARWPGGLIEFFGMTEGGGVCVLHAHDFPDKLHTVGRPAPGSDIRLVDDEGREVAAGETGEIVGRSANVMSGYRNRPEAAAAMRWVAPDGGVFLRTGDMGRLDAEGFLTIMDRKKDMIISGGFNIYPSDIEAVLATHPQVADAAVVGAPSADWGETPVAFVVPRPGAAPAPQELRTWVAQRVGKTQRLADVVLVDELPRSAIGKVLKRELRDRYVAQAG